MSETCLPVPKWDNTRNLLTLSREAVPPERVTHLHLYVWVRGVRVASTFGTRGKIYTVGNMSPSRKRRMFPDKWTAASYLGTLSDPLCVLAVPQLDSRQSHILPFLLIL